MRLRDLEAEFVIRVDDSRRQRDGEISLTQADGVMFLCPVCYGANAGPVGTHSVLCWFRGKVPDHETPGPGRWDPSGCGIDDLTLSPSVHLQGSGCGWHGWVRNGDAA